MQSMRHLAPLTLRSGTIARNAYHIAGNDFGSRQTQVGGETRLSDPSERKYTLDQ